MRGWWKTGARYGRHWWPVSGPIPFGPPDADPVNVFFVLLSPPGRESEHIKLLARVCRLSRHPGFLDDLAAASGPAEALEVVRMVDAEHV
jgi:mannitol/fructose-specific phosphotransferase system IIA component (Ntr-type)